MEYESIIGLEVHAQLKTKSKMFCSCSADFGAQPNSNICPVCTAQPGTLPVVNKLAIEMAIKAGLAVGSQIQGKSIFARKNYFYPDLPKGYQISQYEYPLCLGGFLNIETDTGTKKISIIRIHLEEDAGKLLHDFGHKDSSHVDFNRCGVPLIEIVSGPNMHSPKEAGNYLRTLRNILVYLDVCEGDLEKGHFRCDANISIRPIGQTALGTRTEMKNLNSFKAVEHALAYEIKRQTGVIESGGQIAQETRFWSDAKGETQSMRSKEQAHDYRYFPDPDLTPLIVGEEWINRVRTTLPELAMARSERFITQHGLPKADADILTNDKHIADYFESIVSINALPKKTANWIISELLRELKNNEQEIGSCPIKPESFAKLITLIEDGTISGKIAKDVFADMYTKGLAPEKIIEDKGLKQVSDAGAIDAAIDKVISSCTEQVAQYKSGKAAVFGFLVGQVMKETRGQANPKLVNELLKKKL